MASRTSRGEWVRGLPSAFGVGRNDRKRVHSASERSVGYVFLIEESVQNYLRAAWRVLVAGRVESRRFVFVDECSINTSLTPLYAWSRRGERARCSTPRNRGANVTLCSLA